jgi:hypothetical protein
VTSKCVNVCCHELQVSQNQHRGLFLIACWLKPPKKIVPKGIGRVKQMYSPVR